MALVLHAGQGNKNAYKSLIAAEYCGVKVEHVKEFQKGVSDKTPLFLNRDPVGEVPVLETPYGPLVESNAMARYVAKFKADSTLCGSSAYENVLIEEWMVFAAQIDEGLKGWIYPRMGVRPYNALIEAVVVDSLRRSLITLNNYLATSTDYLVGHSITLADIVMTCDLYFGFTRIMTKSFTSEFPHMEQYFWAHVNHPNFKKVVGEVKQAESVPALPDLMPMDMMLVDQDRLNEEREKRKKDRLNEIIESQKNLVI
ncbi:hypothetical protein LUZ60_004545 [Juncus effusus]|nr:hypothetical protein LUZ60_004545 [Juncus effusus]